MINGTYIRSLQYFITWLKDYTQYPVHIADLEYFQERGCGIVELFVFPYIARAERHLLLSILGVTFEKNGDLSDCNHIEQQLQTVQDVHQAINLKWLEFNTSPLIIKSSAHHGTHPILIFKHIMSLLMSKPKEELVPVYPTRNPELEKIHYDISQYKCTVGNLYRIQTY